MIDTLARHLAAVSEARRLVRMVLDNNPAFRAFDAGGGLPLAPVPGALAADRYFAAYCHLNDAIAALTLESEANAKAEPAQPLTLSEAITQIVPAAIKPGPRCGLLTPGSSPNDAADRAILRNRLRYVLDAPCEHAGVPPSWNQPGDEARVAIVRHGEPNGVPPVPACLPPA